MKKICCDTCDTRLDQLHIFTSTLGVKNNITIEMDDIEYHFCNLKCLQQFINKEIKKEKGNE